MRLAALMPDHGSMARTKANRETAKTKTGRPSKYSATNVARAISLAVAGKTDQEIAENLSVSRSTLSLWKKKHPSEFSDALNDAKAVADDQVEQSLYQMAMGHVGPDGRYYPPNVTAQIFWLKNRRRADWRDKIEHEHGVGDAGFTVNVVLDTGEQAQENAQ